MKVPRITMRTHTLLFGRFFAVAYLMLLAITAMAQGVDYDIDAIALLSMAEQKGTTSAV